jgi:hypothetical protein
MDKPRMKNVSHSILLRGFAPSAPVYNLTSQEWNYLSFFERDGVWKDLEIASFIYVGYTIAKRPTRKEKLQPSLAKGQKRPQN